MYGSGLTAWLLLLLQDAELPARNESTPPPRSSASSACAAVASTPAMSSQPLTLDAAVEGPLRSRLLPASATVAAAPFSRSQASPPLQLVRRPRRERAELSAASRHVHRRVDTLRRAREAALLDRLSALLRSPALTTVPAAATMEADESEVGLRPRSDYESASRRCTRAAKCDVLEACIDEIQRLRGQLEAPSPPPPASVNPSAACSAAPCPVFSPVPTSSSSVSPSPPLSAQLSLLLSQAVVHDAALLSGHVGLLLLSASSGCVLSISEAYARAVGWRVSDVTARRMWAHAAMLHAWGGADRERYLAERDAYNSDPNRPLVRAGAQGAGACWMASRSANQYAASITQLRELYCGQRPSIPQAVWRHQYADGQVHEVEMHSWLTEAEWEQRDGRAAAARGHAGLPRQPRHAAGRWAAQAMT